MRGMTKAQARQFEKLAETELSKVLGPGQPYLETALQWKMNHANGCHVELTLFRDSFDAGNVYRASWLACKLILPDSWRDEGGYSKPQAELPWPGSVFTYPSGKANFHPETGGGVDNWRRGLALHLYMIAAKDSPEREAFGAIEWEAA